MFILLGLLILLMKDGTPATAESISLPLAPLVREQIEVRRGVWMGLSADITLQFVDHGQSASCHGTLTYDRLQEKVTLDCYNLKNKLLFSYQTLDQDFEIYLPAQNKVIKGDIFELQYDPDTHLQLRPLDLYRALKPMLIEEGQAHITDWKEDSLKLNIFKKKDSGSSYLSRSLLVTKQGDITEEIFYTPAEQPSIKITRKDFADNKMKDLKRKVPYPRVTEILSLEEDRKTTLIIRDAQFYLHPQEWPTKSHVGVPVETL